MPEEKIFPGNRTVLAEGKYIRFVRENEWEYVERNNCSGIVIIVAMTESKEVIFVEQFRPPIKHKVIEFPAGLIGDKEGQFEESLEVAAKRELLEETGFEAQSIEKLLEGPVSGGLTSGMVAMVRAHHIEKVGLGGGDETEDIVTHLVPLKDVDSWLKGKLSEGYLIEPKIFSGLRFLEKE